MRSRKQLIYKDYSGGRSIYENFHRNGVLREAADIGEQYVQVEVFDSDINLDQSYDEN